MSIITAEYLNEINEQFKKMCDLIFKQFENLKIQFENNNEMVIEEIVKNEKEIDKYEVNLRDELISILGLHAPKARVLRKIISYFDIIPNLERIGDKLYGISKILIVLNTSDSIFPIFKNDLKKLLDLTNNMIQNALFAFETEDQKMAFDVIDSDDVVDDLNYEILKNIFLLNKNTSTDANITRDILDLGYILNNLERIGDHATNIAEAIIYVTKGEDIKHVKMNFEDLEN
ncbi:MAG: phosphate signaling complex protein PhoU [Bacteroidales bacterium]